MLRLMTAGPAGVVGQDSRRLKCISQVGRSKSIGTLVHHDGELERYPLWRTKPVQMAEQRGNVDVH